LQRWPTWPIAAHPAPRQTKRNGIDADRVEVNRFESRGVSAVHGTSRRRAPSSRCVWALPKSSRLPS